jgi:hypothetical protein
LLSNRPKQKLTRNQLLNNKRRLKMLIKRSLRPKQKPTNSKRRRSLMRKRPRLTLRKPKRSLRRRKPMKKRNIKNKLSKI